MRSSTPRCEARGEGHSCANKAHCTHIYGTATATCPLPTHIPAHLFIRHVSDDGPHGVGDNSLCDGFDRHLLLQWHLDAHRQQLGAEYVMSAWGISFRSTKHTDIKVNTDPDEPRSPSPTIILIVDRFSGNMVIKSIKIQQSTVNFSRRLRSTLSLGLIHGMQQSTMGYNRIRLNKQYTSSR
eukprot:scaffold61668_cov44-Cyclotella_meneghiniana.AAC.2